MSFLLGTLGPILISLAVSWSGEASTTVSLGPTDRSLLPTLLARLCLGGQPLQAGASALPPSSEGDA